MHFLPRAVQLIRETDALLNAVNKVHAKPTLVVVDTFARCFVGRDENSAKDVGLFVHAVDRLRERAHAAVLIVHHTGRDKRHERGSTALVGAADTVLRIAHSKQSGLTLFCDKQKDEDPFDPIPLRLAPVELEDGVTSRVIAGGDARGPSQLPDKHRRALRLLRLVAPPGLTHAQWLMVSGLARATFNRVRADLVRWGYVQSADNHYFVPPPGPAGDDA
jgi:hypothetical protein